MVFDAIKESGAHSWPDVKPCEVIAEIVAAVISSHRKKAERLGFSITISAESLSAVREAFAGLSAESQDESRLDAAIDQRCHLIAAEVALRLLGGGKISRFARTSRQGSGTRGGP